ncbi:hypothetical protein [Halorubellus salinus]|uniref:hypothetical protein n=1 Tax=Halorubellus salinus TaxID=755309 RepID=UPI001D096A24|nr:hypothetical protein [Halorubellus salinus]
MAGRSALAALKSIPGNAWENLKQPGELIASIPRDLKATKEFLLVLPKVLAGKVDDSLPDVDDLGRRRN